MDGFWDGSQGFLADPEDELVGRHSNEHLRSTTDILKPHAGCLVLCGEPGMGKSQTLRSHFDPMPTTSVVRIEFRDVPDSGRFERMTVSSARWTAWRTGTETLTLVVDGVDEGLIKITGFVEYLTALLRDEPVSRLQLVLACRSLEWPVSEGQRLAGLWPHDASSGVYELCPLRERDVVEAAEATLGRSGPRSADTFIRAVRKHHLIALASRPLTLRMLLHEYTRRSSFSRSHRELFRRFGHHLCAEHDDARRTRLRNQPLARLHVPPATRQRVAGRIAALLLLCGRSAIWPGKQEEAAPSDLSFDEICSGPERLAGTEFVVTPTIVEAVLESALFWPRGNGRVGFYHQTFVECLAAEYLNDLPFPQKRALLCRRDGSGEFVHPPLAELAAWMASDSDQLLQHLIDNDPETLLRTDVSAIAEMNRAALVDAVLARASAGELFDGRGVERFFHTLKHPGLGAQLRSVIRDKRRNHVARRVAFRMAEACAVTELLDDAIACLRDQRDTAIHSVAAGSIDDLLESTAGRKVERFLLAKRAQPLSAGVQVSLLHALMRTGWWTLSQALPFVETALVGRDTSGFVFAQHAKPEDAETLLRACLRWPGCFDTLSRFHALVVAAHDQGLSRINEHKIRWLMARVWWRAQRGYQLDGFSNRRRENAPNLSSELRSNRALRRSFIDDLASLPSVRAESRGWKLSTLALTDDFPWLLERAQVGSPRRRSVYAQLAAQSYDIDKHVSMWDILVAGINRSGELRAAFARLDTCDLASPESLKQKESYYESLRWQKEVESRREKSLGPAPKDVWDRDLAALQDEVPVQWMTLASNLFYCGDRERAPGLDPIDVRTSPGWRYHCTEAQKRIVDGARRLILKVPGNPQHVVGGQSPFDEHAYKALYLLKEEIESTPQLGDAVRRHWLPTIFDQFSNADAHHLEMMAIGYRLDPPAMRALLREKILLDAKKDQGLTLELREFQRCWDKQISVFVIELVVNEIRNPRTIECIAEHLAEHDAPAAIELWRRLSAAPNSTEQLVPATAALVSWRLMEVWAEVWPVLRADMQLARPVFLGVGTRDRKGFLEMSGDGVEGRLGQLYLYLRKLFPPAKDPPTPIGRAYTPTRLMEMARLRDELPALLAGLATEAAAAELLKVARSLPDDEALWIRWRWWEALTALRRKTWRPPSPDVVVELVRRSGSRLLTDEDDLVALILESIARLEENLTRKTNSQRRDFWKPVRKGRNGRKYLSPCDETEISRRITTWLQMDLLAGKGITVQREVQIQWDQRTDIEIRAVAISGMDVRPLEVVLEVKGCWHAKVRTAHADQLVGDYLKKGGMSHGIYLVVWTKCDAWNDPADSRSVRLKSKTIEAAREELAELVSKFDGKASPYRLAGIVLDARL